MNQRRIHLSQRKDRRSIFHREEIEPAPDRLIAALPQRIKIGATEMANLDIDFENTPAMRTLKGRSGSWLMSTLRTPKFAHCAHGKCSIASAVSSPTQYSIPPPFQYSSLITLFSVRPRATTFPTPLPDRPRRNPRPGRRPESRYRS
jgi:hypothetical protein